MHGGQWTLALIGWIQVVVADCRNPNLERVGSIIEWFNYSPLPYAASPMEVSI